MPSRAPIKPIKAILFDIDDTLFSTTAFAQTARRNAIQAMMAYGLKGREEDLLKELREVISEFSTNYEHHFDKLLLRLPRACEGINRAILVAAGVVAYHDTKFRELKVYDDVFEVLRELHAKTKIRLGIITAGLEVKQAEKIVRLRIYQFLDPRAIFISDRIGISKPNIKLYQRACNEMGLKPSEVMYIGDNPQNDIYPPQQLGMITCWHRRAAKYKLTPSQPQPNFEIRNFHELRDILVKRFGVKL